jgi:hypothetical protein
MNYDRAFASFKAIRLRRPHLSKFVQTRVLERAGTKLVLFRQRFGGPSLMYGEQAVSGLLGTVWRGRDEVGVPRDNGAGRRVPGENVRSALPALSQIQAPVHVVQPHRADQGRDLD